MKMVMYYKISGSGVCVSGRAALALPPLAVLRNLFAPAALILAVLGAM